MFDDPDLKKLAPSSLRISTYTTDTMKIVGSCLFFLVPLDTKRLQEVTFYVAQNDGIVLLSCTTTPALGLIQPHTRLDYLPPRARLITSSLDHPKKTKKVSVCSSRRDVHSKCEARIYSVKLTTIICQVGDKQGANFTKLPRCP